MLDQRKTERVVVTGGAGFIGGYLINELTRDITREVVVLDNLYRGSRDNVVDDGHRLRFVLGDIRDSQILADLFNGADVVYHLAAQSNVLGASEDPDYSFSTNVLGTFNVLRAANTAHVPKVVFTSSREVYGDVTCLPVSENAPLSPKNLYGASKAAGEMYAQAFRRRGLDVRTLRLANVYGPRDADRVIPRFVAQALRGEALTVYGGTQILDFVWIEHVVQALIRAALLPNLDVPINIGSGRGTTILTLAERVRLATALAAPIVRLPGRHDDVEQYVADVRCARRYLNLPLSQDPLDHLPDVVAWYRADRRPTPLIVGGFRINGDNPGNAGGRDQPS